MCKWKYSVLFSVRRSAFGRSAMCRSIGSAVASCMTILVYFFSIYFYFSGAYFAIYEPYVICVITQYNVITMVQCISWYILIWHWLLYGLVAIFKNSIPNQNWTDYDKVMQELNMWCGTVYYKDIKHYSLRFSSAFYCITATKMLLIKLKCKTAALKPFMKISNYITQRYAHRLLLIIIIVTYFEWRPSISSDCSASDDSRSK